MQIYAVQQHLTTSSATTEGTFGNVSIILQAEQQRGREALQKCRPAGAAENKTGLLCCGFYLEEKLGSLLHDLLDLEEARRVHEQELVPDVHAETPRVAEGQDLLEALRLHGWGQLHHRALPPGVKQIPEVGAAGCQHGTVGLGGKQQGRHVKPAHVQAASQNRKCERVRRLLFFFPAMFTSKMQLNGFLLSQWV